MLLRCVIGGMGGISLMAAPVVKAKEIKEQAENKPNLCRASDLPLYPPPTSTVTSVKTKEPSEIENLLIGPVSTVRQAVCDAIGEVQNAADKVCETANDTAKNFNFVVAYLREEENQPERYGAVVVGTLTGYIFGLRGGIIKRVFYSLVGTGVMGSICFPEEAKVYYAEGLKQGKLATTIAYNFIYGVKPGDPQLELNFPEIKVPHNLSEAVDMGLGFGKSVFETFMPPKTDKDKSSEAPKP